MLDFETTGLSPAQGARITEVAALRIVDGRIVERFVSLINCGVDIPYEITALTGITQTMVDRAPSVETVLPALLDFIGKDALAAHNASFDAKFLNAECERLDLQAGYSELVCSLLLSRRLLPGLNSYRLSNIAASQGIRFSGDAHRAEADAEVSAALLILLSERLQQHHQCRRIDPALLAAIGRMPAAKVPAFLQRQAA
jgi:DNA polymerase III subunit epsilon